MLRLFRLVSRQLLARLCMNGTTQCSAESTLILQIRFLGLQLPAVACREFAETQFASSPVAHALSDGCIGCSSPR
jgi:hypothetical protein